VALGAKRPEVAVMVELGVGMLVDQAAGGYGVRVARDVLAMSLVRLHASRAARRVIAPAPVKSAGGSPLRSEICAGENGRLSVMGCIP